MRAAHPKTAVADALVALLGKRLKELDVTWNAAVFRKGLANPKLPVGLLFKLENLITLAEASNWDVSDALKMELDETVEDIESFNPAFRTRLAKSRREALRDLKARRYISSEALLKKYDIR